MSNLGRQTEWLPQTWKNRALQLLAVAVLLLVGAPLPANDTDSASVRGTVELQSETSVAREVDRLIAEELRRAAIDPAAAARDEDFLRRVTLDFAGTLPSPEDVTLFGLNPDATKRAKVVDGLLETENYARNWARYWRDVIFSNATEMRSRLAHGIFEDWMAGQLQQNRPWDEVAAELITATGDVRENGATALIFAHGGEPVDVAAETSRIFLGIQIQCANCHDHPSDRWKREQFHQLAAYFPRVAVRPKRDEGLRSFEVVSINIAGRRGQRQEPKQIFRRLDRNRDDKLTESEVANTRLARQFDRILEYGDTNKDGAISLEEFNKLPRPNNGRRRTSEYYMPDLDNPASRGTRINPVFFVDDAKPATGLDDLSRRRALAASVTSPDNSWFARAYVNRIWNELIGKGFYMPVDDLGPERSPSFPQVFDLLSEAFAASGYDVKWLFRTIANTATYQRKIAGSSVSEASMPFAAACPTRLRADQLFSAIIEVFGIEEPGSVRGEGRPATYARLRSPRAQFSELFGYDPSTPQADIVGEIPQALFMMNSPTLNNLIRADGNTRLARVLRDFQDDEDAVNELYLRVLAREPSSSEMKICLQYIKRVRDRREAFEDLLWGLLNSVEFLSKR